MSYTARGQPKGSIRSSQESGALSGCGSMRGARAPRNLVCNQARQQNVIPFSSLMDLTRARDSTRTPMLRIRSPPG